MFSNNDFKIAPACENCKYADLYVPFWTYPYHDPKCSIHKKNIKPDDSCKNFELIGRLSR